MRLRSIPILLKIFPVFVGEINSGRLDERHYYRLTNSYFGNTFPDSFPSRDRRERYSRAHFSATLRDPIRVLPSH